MNKYFFISLIFPFQICTAQNLLNPSVETWGVPNLCEVNLHPDNWDNYSNVTGQPDEGNFLLCPTTIPTHASDGDIYARMAALNDSSGEGMYQIVNGLIVGTSYTLKFDYAGSNLFAGTHDIWYHIFINDIDVDQTPVFHSTDTTWMNHSYIFTATNDTIKMGVRLLTPSGIQGSGAIDNFELSLFTGFSENEAAGESLIFPNPTKGLFIINTAFKTKNDVFIYDSMGKEIYLRQNVLLHNFEVDISSFSKGVYFIKVKSGEDYFLKKVVKM